MFRCVVVDGDLRNEGDEDFKSKRSYKIREALHIVIVNPMPFISTKNI